MSFIRTGILNKKLDVHFTGFINLDHIVCIERVDSQNVKVITTSGEELILCEVMEKLEIILENFERSKR